MRWIQGALGRFGLELTTAKERALATLADLSEADRAIVERVAPFTMTSLERRAGLLGAIDHVVRHRVPGAIVECGVWRGGSMMAAALALMARGDTSRELWLYDTYTGMSEPTAADASHRGESAAAQLARTKRGQGVWCEAGLDDVRANLLSIGYPQERIHFVEKKNRWNISPRRFEELVEVLLGFAEVKIQNLVNADREEVCLNFTGGRPREKRFAATRRTIKKHAATDLLSIRAKQLRVLEGMNDFHPDFLFQRLHRSDLFEA